MELLPNVNDPRRLRRIRDRGDGVGRRRGEHGRGPALRARRRRSTRCPPIARASSTPDDDEVGWLARCDHVPLGYLDDEAATVSTFPIIDGVRVAVPGDRARFTPDGQVELLGRDSLVVNTGGEKVFVEEVEAVLKRHDDVVDVLVIGRPSERFGHEVTAIVQLAPSADRRNRRRCGSGAPRSRRGTRHPGRSCSSSASNATRAARRTTNGHASRASGRPRHSDSEVGGSPMADFFATRWRRRSSTTG